jgi:hypothetical protein
MLKHKHLSGEVVGSKEIFQMQVEDRLSVSLVTISLTGLIATTRVEPALILAKNDYFK